MKKIILVFLICLFICGCTRENKNNPNTNVNTVYYYLKINKKMEENINFSLPKNAYQIAEKYDLNNEFTSDEYKLLYMDLYPVTTDGKTKYNKQKIVSKDRVNVILNYDYLEKEFLHNTFIYMCFEHYEMNATENYFELKLSGKYYCKSVFNALNIHIDTDYDIISANGIQTKNGYKWLINNDNYDNVDITYKIKRDIYDMAITKDKKDNKNITNIIIRIVIFAIILSAIGATCLIVIKNKKM